jgi:hypothetical protein
MLRSLPYLGRREHLLRANDLDLASHDHLTSEEVDVLHGETEDLALAQAKSGPDRDHH